MRRIVVIGSPGAGKSVLARQLGELLGIEVFDLDELYWQGGRPPSREQWTAVARGLVTRDCWVVDGNYSATLAERLDAADTAVFLDLPRTVCLLRYLRRRFRGDGGGRPRGRRPPVTWSALRGILTFPSDHRPAFLDVLAERQGRLRIVVLRRPDDVRRFLAEVEQDVL